MSHTPSKYAPILSLEDFAKLRDDPSAGLGVVVATSGGFDPIHPGHVTCIFFISVRIPVKVRSWKV